MKFNKSPSLVIVLSLLFSSCSKFDSLSRSSRSLASRRGYDFERKAKKKIISKVDEYTLFIDVNAGVHEVDIVNMLLLDPNSIEGKEAKCLKRNRPITINSCVLNQRKHRKELFSQVKISPKTARGETATGFKFGQVSTEYFANLDYPMANNLIVVPGPSTHDNPNAVTNFRKRLANSSKYYGYKKIKERKWAEDSDLFKQRKKLKSAIDRERKSLNGHLERSNDNNPMDAHFERLANIRGKVTRLIVSGHHAGKAYKGENGGISTKEIIRYVKKYDLHKSLKAIYLMGCYTGVSEDLKKWTQAMNGHIPKGSSEEGVKVIFGFEEKGPLSETPKGQKMLRDLLIAEEELITTKDINKTREILNTLASRYPDREMGIHINAEKRTGYAYNFYSNMRAKSKVELNGKKMRFNGLVHFSNVNDDEWCDNENGKISRNIAGLKKYYSGDQLISSNNKGERRKIYSRIQEMTHCLKTKYESDLDGFLEELGDRKLPQSTDEKVSLLRKRFFGVLFYPVIQENFGRYWNAVNPSLDLEQLKIKLKLFKSLTAKVHQEVKDAEIEKFWSKKKFSYNNWNLIWVYRGQKADKNFIRKKQRELDTIIAEDDGMGEDNGASEIEENLAKLRLDYFKRMLAVKAGKNRKTLTQKQKDKLLKTLASIEEKILQMEDFLNEEFCFDKNPHLLENPVVDGRCNGSDSKNKRKMFWFPNKKRLLNEKNKMDRRDILAQIKILKSDEFREKYRVLYELLSEYGNYFIPPYLANQSEKEEGLQQALETFEQAMGTFECANAEWHDPDAWENRVNPCTKEGQVN